MNNKYSQMTNSVELDKSMTSKKSYIIDEFYTVERIVTYNDNIEVFSDELFYKWKSIFISHSMETKPEDVLIKYNKQQSRLSESQKQKQDYLSLSSQDKKDYLIWECINVVYNWDRFTWTSQINIADIRKTEPQIDIYLQSIIKSISEVLEMTEDEVIHKYIILDEQSKKVIKTDNIEWIQINSDSLVNKLWDLFYDSLWNILSQISSNLLLESQNNKEIWELELSTKLKEASEYINKASINIFTAWKICLPYISTNFITFKHTSQIEELQISNLELSNRISILKYNKLSELLELLSIKLKQDWQADKWRWRIKLSTELFEASENLLNSTKLFNN